MKGAGVGNACIIESSAILRHQYSSQQLIAVLAVRNSRSFCKRERRQPRLCVYRMTMTPFYLRSFLSPSCRDSALWQRNVVNFTTLLSRNIPPANNLGLSDFRILSRSLCILRIPTTWRRGFTSMPS